MKLLQKWNKHLCGKKIQLEKHVMIVICFLQSEEDVIIVDGVDFYFVKNAVVKNID